MNVCVVGAGTMGHGIAQVSAMGGHDVTLRDIEEDFVADGLAAIEANLDGGVERGKVTEEAREATLSRLTGTTDLAEAVADADLVVEAVPEDEELKKRVLSEVADHAPDDTVLATNTSSLPVTSIASALSDPSRCVGLHFFNPPHIMQLVEVVLAEQTSNETREFAETFVDCVDRTAVVVEDTPGFATSRLGVALGVEAVRMVESGVASPRDIDAAMELGYNHPMGPLELGDVVGLDVRLDILEHLREELGERFRPPTLLRKKVRAEKLGKKTGEGFYVWEDGEIVGVSGEDDE
ncbi:3-hydroxyacyl-CoA dehydrogenase family protein [Haloprofundus salilacus]|uniref:3-hydroxyacyl-CoA dehydrogenase family protein n=1 Tax=Haloprofundus salilacus TaxID=2876190 RepID=UPI001CCB5189|nr:3-hydroxyacyl-CoA dehydrogenase family protein [Haloprofundus salilacus]